MLFTSKIVLPTVALFALVGCTPAPAPATFTEADRAANLAVTAAFRDRVMAKDWEGGGKLYAANAVMLPPNTPPLRGPAAIKGYMTAFPPFTEFTIVDNTLVGTAY